ncbi:MAG: DUF2306 domain-containing protein [Gemmatimonadales bacterium]|nr:MAG: DUF2306 domain-containing protein [Gemmatimonadales bacterium]
MRPGPAWWLVALLSGAIALYALGHLVFRERVFVDALAASFKARPWGIYPHAFFGMIAITLGPLQFLPTAGMPRGARHRTLGKIYVGAAMMTGVTGLYMAAWAHGGRIAEVGFTGMALAILATTALAWKHAVSRDFPAHRRWMIRSYAVLFSAVTLRLWLPVVVVLHAGAFTPSYRWVAWLSWIPNVLWAEWYVRKRPHPAALN